jgi:hypothetical protein
MDWTWGRGAQFRSDETKVGLDGEVVGAQIRTVVGDCFQDLSQCYEPRIRIACDVITFCARGFRQRQIRFVFTSIGNNVLVDAQLSIQYFLTFSATFLWPKSSFGAGQSIQFNFYSPRLFT